jgi:hypothetical protein
VATGDTIQQWLVATGYEVPAGGVSGYEKMCQGPPGSTQMPPGSTQDDSRRHLGPSGDVRYIGSSEKDGNESLYGNWSAVR